MNWYSGSIAEAVQQSKLRNAIFVVFVEGPNENSKQMAKLIDSESIRRELESSKYVAIRIQSETEAYTQFADIYKLVPLPSIFFLGDNGAPRAIVTEVTKTVDELEAIIQSVQLPADEPSAASLSVQEASVAAGVAATSAPAGESSGSVSERMRRAQELIELKRKEHEAEQQRLEKERELQRRQAGQELRSFKERQAELELKQLREERQRDKLAEQAVRKRILDQIAQDRATNAARFANSEVSAPTSAPAAPAAPRVFTGSEARIQFRKPDGSLVAHEFLASDAFHVVRDYVANELLGGSSNFTLASSFPRRLFSDQDADTSLVELDLAPTAVILVQSSDKALQGNANAPPAGASSAVRGAAAAVSRLNVLALMQSAFWTLMVPVLAVVGYLRNLVGRGGGAGGARDVGAQKRENEERISDNDAAKRRNLRFLLSDQQPSTSAAAAANNDTQKPASSTTAYKRTTGSGTSNIHRLRETQDSDDETNTWNGNSTQQQ